MLNSFLKFVAGKWTNTAVSSSNPLPTTNIQLPASVGVKKASESLSFTNSIGIAAVQEAYQGRQYILRILQSAVAFQYTRVQVYNPVGSGIDLQLTSTSVYGTTVGIHIYSTYFVDIDTELGSAPTTAYSKNVKGGGAELPSIQLLARNSATAIQTTGLLGNTSSSNIAPAGLNVIFSSIFPVIPPGTCLEIAIGTANVGLVANLTVWALPADN